MITTIILIAMLINIACYLYYSTSQKTYVNALTPGFIISVPSLYALELVYIYYNGCSATVEAYWFVFLAYALNGIITVFVLLRVKVPAVLAEVRPPAYQVKYSPYLLLLASFLLYLPILLEFHDYLSNPRQIYYLTRTGYGLNFFVSSMVANVAFILILFKKQSYRMERLIFFLICATLALLHGSKGQVVTLVFIWILHAAYIQKKRVSMRRFVAVVLSFCIGIPALFFFLSTDPNIEVTKLLRHLSGYADYSRNAMMLIDNDLPPLWGRLTFEDAVYSRIPRKIYANKPKDFGSFYLAKLYYPEWFEADTGSPAFGVGVTYADFKEVSILYIVIASFISAYLLKIFILRTVRFRSPGDFVLMLFFAGVILLPIGVGYLLPEHFAIAVIIWFLLRPRCFLGIPYLRRLKKDVIAPVTKYSIPW